MHQSTDNPYASPHSEQAAPNRQAYVTLALLLVINLLNYIDRYVLAAIALPLKKDLFSSDNPAAAYWLSIDPSVDFWIGMLSTAFLLSYMFTAPLFGWLGDRMQRWLIVGLGVTAWSLASGGSGLAATFGWLLTARLFIGIGEAAYGPLAPTLISDQFPVSRRGTVMSYLYVAIPVGSAAGLCLWRPGHSLYQLALGLLADGAPRNFAGDFGAHAA